MNLQRNGRKTIFWIGTFFLLLLHLLGQNSKQAQAATVKIQVQETDGTVKKYSNSGEKVSLDGKTVSTKELPSIQIGDVWMVSVREVFEAGLGCIYEEEAGRITLTNPRANSSVIMTVGSREIELTGEDEEDKNDPESLPYQPVAATNLGNEKSGILVPVSFLAQALGYYCEYQSDKENISLTTQVFMDRDAAVPEYDTSTYTNVLTTVLLEQNSSSSREELTLITLHGTTQENVLIQEEDDKGIYTYTFLNTYNAVGEMEEKWSTGFVKKISVTTSGQDVVVRVNYKVKYISMTMLEEDGVFASFSSATYSLKVRLPENVTYSQVKDTDKYMKKQFVFELPGDWEEYYEEHPVLANNNVIQKVEVTVTASDKTCITVTTKRLQGYKLTEKNGYFIAEIDDPKKIYSNIVVLDAGHGGKDHGAKNNGTKEKNLNLKIIYTLAQLYFDSEDSNVKAYWTRTDDTFISLSERSRFAASVDADLFISLHMNSCNRPAVNGMEIYYSKDNHHETNSGLTSRILAKKLLNKVKGDLDAPSRGVKSAGFYVIKHNSVPAVLLELGFLSGTSDYKKLTSDQYQKKAAQSIYEGIVSIFEAYPTGR